MMRRLLSVLMIALLLLTCAAFAEGAQTAASVTNGADAVRTATDIYFAIPSAGGQMLVRLPLGGGTPVCVDRAERFDDLLPYAGGIAYLKTEATGSAIMHCSGNEVASIYSFGQDKAVRLSYSDGKFLAMLDGLLHSIDPNAQLCLKLSGAKMLDYVLAEGSAYYLSDGDRLEYTAQLEGNQTVSTQAGCIYRLDLSTGETTLMLKSGGTDLKIRGGMLYFHNLADAYAVRMAEQTELRGRVYSLDVQLKGLESECAEPDSGFWPTDRGLVVWYGGALNLNTEAGALALYTPENGSTVVSDGASLYAWEATGKTLTQINTNGSSQILYTGDLTQAIDASLIVPEATPEVTPEASSASDQAATGNDAWFEQFVQNANSTGSGSSSSLKIKANATPIPAITPQPAPEEPAAVSASSAGSSGSSSSAQSASSGTYSTSAKYLKMTGNVNFRAKAGTGSKILGTIPKGTIVKCTGKGAKASNGSWYQVEYHGDTGWVSAQYAQKTGAPDSTYMGPASSLSGDHVTIVNGSVTLRKYANKDSKSLGTISEGTDVDFLNRQSTDMRGVKWYKVEYDGKTGWVSSKYAKVKGSGSGSGGSGGTGNYVKSINGGVAIRADADKDSAKLGAIPDGKTASYLGNTSTDSRGVDWYEIKYNGITGWVSSKYSKRTTSGGSGGGSSAGKVKSINGGVTIRKSADKDSKKLGAIPDGKTCEYLGSISTDSRGVDWYKIKYNGITGWVSSKYSKRL